MFILFEMNINFAVYICLLWNDIWVIIHHPNINYFTYIIHHSSLHNPIHHPTFIILLTQFIVHHYIILFLSYILSSLLIIKNSSSNIHHSTYIINHSLYWADAET
jgi:hypothetical protein